jgi:hypothetical protein
MATKQSASAKEAFQLHTTLEYRRGDAPGIIVRHGGGDELRYLEFALPDSPRSVRVEWKGDVCCCSAGKGDKGVPVRLIVDNGAPRALTYKNGFFYQRGRSAPFVDKKAAVIGQRLAEVFSERRGTTRTAKAQKPSGVTPFGWFSCMSDFSQNGAGVGGAIGGVAGGVSGGVAGGVAGAGAGAGLGAAAGALLGLGWCTTSVILGVS